VFLVEKSLLADSTLNIATPIKESNHINLLTQTRIISVTSQLMGFLNRLYIKMICFRMSYDEYTNEQAGTASLDISVSTLVMPLNYVQAIFKYINVTYNWEYGVYTTSCNQTNIQAIKFDDGNIVINASEFIVDLDIGPSRI
jgi:hypothetical protein